ncbi:MAG: pyridoxal phosphate-dependent aminotransferase [Deltaproteobacteria bacterium]
MFEEGARLKAERGADRVFDFSLGNPFGDPPARFAETLRSLAASPPPDLHRYMPNAGYPEVRREVAKSLSAATGQPFREELVVMTCGAAGALNVALRAILSPGDEVLVIAPYFVEYFFYIRNAGGVPAVAESSEDFQLDIGLLRERLTEKTRAVLLNTPNNPTGAVYPGESLAALDRALAEMEERTGRPIYVLSDEPYRKILYPGAVFAPPASFLRNVLVAYSHSKDLNLPGERIGYLAVSPRAADAEEVAGGAVFCNRVLGFVNAPSLMQRAVADLQEVPADMSVYRENRDRLLGTLTDAGFRVVPPGGAFYLFPASPGDDEMEFLAAAREEGILLVPGTGFGRRGYFRIAFCVAPEVVRGSLPGWKRLGERFFGGAGGSR